MAHAAATSKKILVVDPDPNFIILLETILIEADYDVITAHSGEEALKKIESENPDLVTTEIDLVEDGISGLELTRRIKANPDTEDIRVVMITHRAQYVDGLRGLQAGAFIYIEKLADPDEVLSSIKEIFKQLESPTREKEDEEPKTIRW